MRARVKASSNYPSIRSAGIMFTREWQDVPAWAQHEISVNPFLEVEHKPHGVEAPEPEQEQQPAPKADAVEMKITNPAKAKGKRKL